MLDPLTQIPNREGHYQELGKVIARLGPSERREGLQSSYLLFMDIDNFKQYNDEMGQTVGDEFLKGLAAYLTDNVRDVDAVCRVGGDEFTVIMNGFVEQSEEDARKVFQRLAEEPRQEVHGEEEQRSVHQDLD